MPPGGLIRGSCLKLRWPKAQPFQWNCLNCHAPSMQGKKNARALNHFARAFEIISQKSLKG